MSNQKDLSDHSADAQRLGVQFIGMQESVHGESFPMFNDPLTNSSFISTGETLESALCRIRRPFIREVQIYTDGACSGNPGPGGVGVVLSCNGHEREISCYLGPTTNNRAELSAVIEGLKALKSPALCSVTLFTDSQLVHGLLSCNWKATKNLDLVSEVKKLSAECSEFKCIRTPTINCSHLQKADKLAKAASKSQMKGGEQND